DSRVWLFDEKGRFVMEALLANTIGVLPTSRLEEGRDRRAAGQLKRLERKGPGARHCRADPITAQTQVAAIESLRPGLLPTAAPVQSAFFFEDRFVHL
ncbi:hypothetical protein ACHMXK_20715, partial [Polaromonas sp. UC242_47]